MKKLLILFCVFLSLLSIGHSNTIKGGVSYTVDLARQDAFNDTQYKIDIKEYSSMFKDKNHKNNLILLSKHRNKYKNRYLISFSDETYAVSYVNNRKVAYYYDNEGFLYAIDISNSETYPRKTLKYNINGDLEGVSIDLSSNEQYIFDNKKRLVGHWIGNNGYDEKGELFGTRK